MLPSTLSQIRGPFTFSCATTVALISPCALAQEEPDNRVERDAPTGSIFVDTVSLGLWGQSAGLEVGLPGGSMSFVYRAIGFGVASQLIFADHEFIHLLHSMGLAVRGTVYPNDDMAGVHYGGGLEYARIAYDDEDYLDYAVANYAIASAQAGYRFRFGRVYLDPSAAAGAAIYLGRSVVKSGFNDEEMIKNEGGRGIFSSHRPIGEVRLDFGVYF